MFSNLKVVRKEKRKKKSRINCYSCLESSKTEIPGKVFCHCWKVVVNCTRARICPDFTPHAPSRKARRRGGVRV